MATIIDTHEIVQELRAADFTEKQAEAVARIVRKRVEADLSQLATKSDVAELRGEMRLLRWMTGTVIAGVAALMLRAFFPG